MSMHRMVITFLCANCVVLPLYGMQEPSDKKNKRFSRVLDYVSPTTRKVNDTFNYQDHLNTYDIHASLSQDFKREQLDKDSCIQFISTYKKQDIKKEEKVVSGYVPQAVYSLANWAKSLLITQSKTQEIPLQEIYTIDWNNPYVLEKQTSLKDGCKNYLQWFKSRESGVEVYDADLRKMIIKEEPVLDAGWTDSNSCYCVTRQRVGAQPEALVYDFKNRTEHIITPCTGNMHRNDRFFGTNENVRFVTTLDNVMQITHIRPERNTYRVFRKDCALVRSFFCDTYVWVLYKEKQTHQFPHSFKQIMVVYDIQQGYKPIKEIEVEGRLVRPWDWYITTEKNYISLCMGDMLHVYDMTTGELKYKNKQRVTEYLMGIWNTDGSRYVITNDSKEFYVTAHDLSNKRSVELYRVNNKSILCESGFQNQYVAVRVIDDQVDHTLFRFYDCDAQEDSEAFAFSCKGKARMYGYGPQHCYVAVSNEEYIIYRYRENTIRLQKDHNGILGAWGGKNGGNRYCVMDQSNTMVLLDFSQGSVKEVLYNDILHYARFNDTGDTIMLAYGHKVDILKNPTAEIITTLDLGGFTAKRTVLSPDCKICAVLLQDDETIINIYNAQTGERITQLGYCDDVVLMQFNELGTLFFVATEKETYTYGIKK